MARKTIGSVIKGKDGKPDYIKISQDVTLKQGQYVNLESKKARLDSLTKAESEGKLSADLVTKIRSILDKEPEFVRFSLTVDVDKKQQE